MSGEQMRARSYVGENDINKMSYMVVCVWEEEKFWGVTFIYDVQDKKFFPSTEEFFKNSDIDNKYRNTLMLGVDSLKDGDFIGQVLSLGIPQ